MDANESFILPEDSQTGLEGPEKGDSTSRLIIEKIVCENFKSYAGVRELGPFHKVITSAMCIVFVYKLYILTE